jgi:phosphatidate cytidylyltransferase
VFLIALGGVAILACDELLRMCRAAGFESGRWLPLAVTAGLLAAAWWFGLSGLCVAIIGASVLLPTARLRRAQGPAGSLGGIATESFAVLWIGTTGACFGWLRLLPGDELGVRFLLFYLFCVWVGDSGAFYVGRWIGRHKMSPRISPNKTLEGLAGGVVATYVAALIAWWAGLGMRPADVAAVATILAIAAPTGDLVESMLKRDSGVKDSSAVLPGHGGLLDRTDSLFYPAPMVLAYLAAVGII